MLPEMLPQQIPAYHDRSLRIRGVDVALRIFTKDGQFVFQTSRPLSHGEKIVFASYMKNEGFLDDPISGDFADQITV